MILTQDELQTLIDRDIQGSIMDEACATMGVSKTVYAGIYASAREKVTKAIVHGYVLTIDCSGGHEI